MDGGDEASKTEPDESKKGGKDGEGAEERGEDEGEEGMVVAKKKKERNGLSGAAASLVGVGGGGSGASAGSDEASRKRQRDDGSPGSGEGSPSAADGKRAKRSVSPVPGDDNYGLANANGSPSGLQITEAEVRQVLLENAGTMKASQEEPADRPAPCLHPPPKPPRLPAAFTITLLPTPASSYHYFALPPE